jgi:regulator of sigma E protease
VEPDSPAARAGFQPADRVVRVEDKHNPTWEEFGIATMLYSDRPIDIAVMRANQVVQLKLNFNKNFDQNFQGLQPKDTIVGVTSGRPAEKAGMKNGDEIVSINGQKMTSIPAIIDFLKDNKDKPVDLVVLREGQAKHFNITPVAENDNGETRYRIGISSLVHTDRLSFHQALSHSVEDNRKNSALIFTLLQKLVEKKVSLKQMDGPIGIGRAVSTAVQRPTLQDKAINLTFLMSVISLNLGIFNLLPIPILDGGLILLTTIEGIMRRDISQRLKERIYQTAFVFLVIFAAVVIFNDVTKWMS